MPFKFWVTYALLALYPSVLTKSHFYICPSCSINISVDQESLVPFMHYNSSPFNFDQESLMPFLHYILKLWPRVTYMPFLYYILTFWPGVTYTLLALYLQFWPRVCTYALHALYPSILTKSHLCPSCTIPFNFDQESLMPNVHVCTYVPFLHFAFPFV